MKALSLSILFLLIAFVSCKKDEISANLIVGEWELKTVEYQQSGNRSKKNTPNKAEVLVSFNQSGEFNETYKNVFPVEFGFLGCGGGNYELEGDNEIRIRALCMSSLTGRKFKIVRISEKELVLDNNSGSKFTFEK